MNKSIISDVLTIMFANKGVTDNIELMRCNILAMEIERQVLAGNCSIETVKASIAFRSTNYDLQVPDEFLQELIDRANLLNK